MEAEAFHGGLLLSAYAGRCLQKQKGGLFSKATASADALQVRGTPTTL